MSFRSALYRGELMHARHDLHRVFRYPMYVASLDLDELPRLHRELRLFSHRRPNLFAFDERYFVTFPIGNYAAKLFSCSIEHINFVPLFEAEYVAKVFCFIGR